MYRKFGGKRYRAYQEYTTKTEAKKGQAKMKVKGYLGRLFYSKWSKLWILYVRKKTATSGSKTTVTKVKSHQPMGRYKRTSVDERKETADFRLMQVSPYIIAWKNGKVEEVTRRRLEKLQKTHTCATDF